MINILETDDLVCNESFVRWVNSSGIEDAIFWNNWIAESSAHKKRADQAIDFLSQIVLSEVEVSVEQNEMASKRLLRNLSPVIKQKSKRVSMLRMAAAILLLLGVGAICFYVFNKTSVNKMSTPYGETKEALLPDGTLFVLNANSELTFPKKWEDGKVREVWVKGEAFFHVKKTKTASKFIVHTNAFDIEVTGTQFDVVNDHQKSSVVLREGSVIIHRKGSPDIHMLPGEKVFVSNDIVKKHNSKVEKEIAWIYQNLDFDQVSIDSVCKIIERHYGSKVILQGDFGNNRITGILPNNNLDVLLQSLEATLDLDIKYDKEKNEITLKKTE